jgi:hypothetical protein
LELSDTSHFHIDLFGNYIPGLCSGLAILRDDLGQPLTPEKYPLLTTLFHSGIRGLADMAQNEFGYKPAKTGYINKCDVCAEIRTFLMRSSSIESSELHPAEFYLNIPSKHE